jgi:hypothetical protein
MSARDGASAFALRKMTGYLVGTALASLDQALAELPETGELWGFWTTPARAGLGRRAAAEWQAVLSDPRLLEARVFGEALDLHWLAGRGFCLRPAGAAPGEAIGGGEEWLERERRSRLWGEWLAEAAGWYEERIPDPQRYEGLVPGRDVLAFLVYREYVAAGVVRYVRYLRVEGAPR